MTSQLYRLVGELWRRSRDAHKNRRVDRAFERAQDLERDGDARAARHAYEKVLASDPARAVVHHRLGVLCAQQADYDAALTHLRHALSLDPEFRDAHVDVGNVHRMRDEPDAAVAHYRSAIAIDPDCGLAHFNLGRLLKALHRFEEALPSLERAVDRMPESADALSDYVYCLIETSRFDEATAILTKQMAAAPNDVQLKVMLGFAYQRKQEPEVALAHYQTALELGADVAELHSNLGIVLRDLGRIDEAVAHHDRALALKPQFPFAVFHRAIARLCKRDYAAWHEYEARLLTEQEHSQRRTPYPRWNGSPLEGTLLVYSEQGLGDEIMFASCLPDAIRSVRRCIVECAPKLEGLYRRSFPAATIYAATSDRTVPEHVRALNIDCEIPVGSLPVHYRTSRHAFPAHTGYLEAAPERTQHWRSRVAELGTGIKVGISWRGGLDKTRRSVRSIPPHRWSPILQAPDACFVSLQYGAKDTEIQELDGFAQRHGRSLVHWPEAIEDYEETAALVTALDLVISVCTAVIHLGGALGRPVWVMAPYSPAWPYGFRGTGMPWYPSVRLYRQPVFDAWDPVIQQVALELRTLSRAA